MQKLYVIVRNDLRPGLQCAQACHAQHEFFRSHRWLEKEWEGNLVVLQVPDEESLQRCEAKLGQFAQVTFREPDLGHQRTAIAVEGQAAPWLTEMPLALRDARSRDTVQASRA